MKQFQTFQAVRQNKISEQTKQNRIQRKGSHDSNHTWKTYLAGIGKNCADIKFDALLMKIY